MNFSSFSSTTTVTYTYYSDHSSPIQTTEIPINSPPPSPIKLNLHASNSAAIKIQSTYRAHIIRNLYKQISTVNSEATHLQSQIQRQETVDAIRTNPKERLRVNETLMGLLLKLDSVPGFDPTVRDARRKVSRRIVGLQEIVDGICEAKVEGGDGFEWDPYRGGPMLRDWDELIGVMEEEVCRERGGDEMEKFCAEYLGFRCLQRFLRQP